jgi:hypothetical protein
MSKKPVSAFVIITLFFLLMGMVAPLARSQTSKHSLLNAITDSMQPKAFAETGLYGGNFNYAFTSTDAENVADIDFTETVCLAEGNSTTISTIFDGTPALGIDDPSLITFTASQVEPSPLVTISPETTDYPDETPLPLTHDVELTAPMLPDDSPVNLTIQSRVRFYTQGQSSGDEVIINLVVAPAGTLPDECADALYVDADLLTVVDEDDPAPAESESPETNEPTLADTGADAAIFQNVGIVSMFTGLSSLGIAQLKNRFKRK